MKIKLLVLIIFAIQLKALSCSMYKITMHGKTFVGNNEDGWRANTRIWTENGKTGEYGAMYVGYDDLYPQGGMNEKGLVFDGFFIDEYTPRIKSKKPIFQASMGKTIMKTCQNVDEVRTFLSNYNLSSLRRGMVMFVDKSGHYLVVEADTMIKGNDEKYILSNFCPSRTPDLDAVNIPFYQKGRKMLEAEADTSLNYLKSLSDTVHQEWPLNGAGTLYTTIYDLNEGTVNLFFYHDYKYSIKYKLKDELNKGDTIFIIPALFPDNAKGQDQFQRYNETRALIQEIKTTEIAKDSTALYSYITSKDLKTMPGFFEGEINAVGYAFVNEKDINSAINVFRLNLKYSPHSWRVHFGLAECYLKKKDYALALTHYKTSLKRNPDNEAAMKAIIKINRRLSN